MDLKGFYKLLYKYNAQAGWGISSDAMRNSDQAEMHT